MPSNNTFQVDIIRKIFSKFSVADTAHSDKSITFARRVDCHDCYFTVITRGVYASGFFRLSFNVYLSLKEQECTKRIEKISVVTLPVFAFHNSQWCYILGDRKCKQRARNKCRFSFAVQHPV